MLRTQTKPCSVSKLSLISLFPFFPIPFLPNSVFTRFRVCHVCTLINSIFNNFRFWQVHMCELHNVIDNIIYNLIDLRVSKTFHYFFLLISDFCRIFFSTFLRLNVYLIKERYRTSPEKVNTVD